MNTFVKVRSEWGYEYLVNINQISYIIKTGNKYKLFFGETAMEVVIDAYEAQKIFAKIGTSL